MVRKGVLTSRSTPTAPNYARRLNTEAAKTMKWGGLTEDEAFALVTINPAKQLRIDNRVGSLEAGKDADVVIWNRHPLSTYATAERVYIDGTVYYDRKAEEARLTALKKEKSTLAAAEQGGRGRPRVTGTGTARAATSAGADRDVNDAVGDACADRQSRRRSPATTGAAPAAHPGGKTGGAAPSCAIINASIHPISRPTIERGHHRASAATRSRRSAPASQVPAGAKVVDAAGADVYPGFINARTTDGPERAGTARVRRHQRDARLQPAAAHARRVSLRERHDRGHPRQRRSRPSRSCPAAESSAAKSRS